jgi:ATP-binding protein involved in chromosome partitioning
MTFEQQFKDLMINENMNRIQQKIMVMSNKGGVGKSTIAANIAHELSNQGYKTGILDIDLHGPSQGEIFNISNLKLKINQEKKIIPFQIKENLKLVTIAGIIENEQQALIWRGPMKINVIKQFLTDVLWEDLDYLIIDAPPGTGDEPLTIVQLIPNLNGIVLVTTPHDLAILDSKKAITFANKLNINILGIVENMSYFQCPHCLEKTNLFKKKTNNDFFQKSGIEILGSLPFDSNLLDCLLPTSFTNQVIKEITQKLIKKQKKNE